MSAAVPRSVARVAPSAESSPGGAATERVLDHGRLHQTPEAGAPQPVGHVGRHHRLRLVLALIVAALAVYPAWLARFDLINDTVSYLDMGDLFWSGQFGAIVNGTWGPLYAVLLGAWLRLVNPAPQWEYAAIHVLLFGVFLSCIACFDAFLASLLEFRERQSAPDEHADGSGPALTIIGYVIFAWVALLLVGIQETNPDMLVAAFFFLACACVLRIHTGGAGWRLHSLLGLAVAGCFLTKPATGLAGVALILAAATAGPDLRSRLRAGLTIAAVAGVLALPYVAALSLKEGHFTVSESGAYNYAVHVGGVPALDWQGETPGAGRPTHPTRQLLESPPVFEFDTPLPGTYPLWFDPSYWYQGVKAPVDWSHLRSALTGNAHAFAFIAFSVNGALLSALILLQSFGLRRPHALRRMLVYWIVAVPALLSLVPYAAIHWEARYVAGGVGVLLVTTLACARLPVLPQTRQIYVAAATFVVTLFFLPGGPSSPASTLGVWKAMQLHWPQSKNVYWEAASALHDAGYAEGTKVATIEFGDINHQLWARLARDQIVAEIYYPPVGPQDRYPREKSAVAQTFFWDEPSEARAQALAALKSAGAQVLVTAITPRGPDADQWRELGDSGYYFHSL
jgi:hypothetical protein